MVAPPVLALRRPFLAPASPPHHPSPPTPIPGEGLHPWETQACAFSSSWFSREPWLEGDGRRSPGGRGSGGSQTGNWKGKGVGGPRSSLPPTFLLPVPSPSWLAHWRQGLGPGELSVSVSQCLSEGGVGEATAPPPPAEACGGGGAQALLVRWLEAHT